MLVYLLFFIVFVGNFVCSDGGAQPWPLHIEKIGSCCSSLQFSNKFGVIEDSETLNRCLSQEYFPRVNGIPSETNVSLLVLSSPGTGTFAIDKIDYYTPFQFSVIASYCEQRHYHCHLLSSLPSLEVNHILEDFRWYKVQLLIDAFTSWGKDQQAIVWIDSDAIILDFGLSIEEILRLYSDADIIASADIKLGLVNTGFMIFRNTEWTLSFLREWWSIADKSVTCDQEAFDQLYLQLLSSSSLEQKKTGKIPKIQILSTDQINSHPPAWLHHKNNPVLHLMGEISLYRAEVFRKAFYSICQARSGGVLPTLLNIRRDYLLEVARQVYRNETQQSFLLANQSGNLYDYERFSKASHHYVDVLQHDLEKQIKKLGSRGRILSSQSSEQQISKLQEEILKIRKALFHLCLLRIENINQLLTQTNEKIKDLQTPRHQQTRDDVPSIESLEDVFTYQNQSNELLVDLLQFEKKGAEAGNSYFWSLPVTAIPEKENVSEQILRLLNDLIDRVDIQSQLVPYHMKALLHQNLGIMYYEEYQRLSTESAKELNVREELLRKAKRSTKFSLEIFDRYFQQSNDSSTQLEYLHTVQLLAAIYCIEKDYSHGLSFWQRAVDQAMQSTKGLQIGIHFEKLSIVLFNAAICFREDQKPLKALELLKQSKDTLNQLILEKRSKHSNEMVYNKQMDDIQYLFKMVTNYLNDTEVEFNQLSSSTNLNPKSKSPEPLHASPAISKSDTPVMKMIHNADGSVKYIPEDVLSQLKPGSEDDYEWEECTDLENDDCETFYVHEEQTSLPSDGVPDKEQQEKLHIEMSENKVVDDESYLYEGLSEEEARELSEIRKRYARATSKSVSDSINQLNNQNERATKNVENIVEGNTGKPSDLQSQVIQLLNEKIALMEEIQNLKQENRLLKQRMKQIVGIGALSD